MFFSSSRFFFSRQHMQTHTSVWEYKRRTFLLLPLKQSKTSDKKLALFFLSSLSFRSHCFSLFLFFDAESHSFFDVGLGSFFRWCLSNLCAVSSCHSHSLIQWILWGRSTLFLGFDHHSFFTVVLCLSSSFFLCVCLYHFLARSPSLWLWNLSFCHQHWNLYLSLSLCCHCHHTYHRAHHHLHHCYCSLFRAFFSSSFCVYVWFFPVSSVLLSRKRRRRKRSPIIVSSNLSMFLYIFFLWDKPLLLFRS